MYGVQIDMPLDVVTAAQEQLRLTPSIMAQTWKRGMTRLKSRWIVALRVEPPAASNYYPLPYKSAKQRRKVHMLRRERGGGAYIRTHGLRDGWNVEIEALDSGGSTVVSNPAPNAGFVIGDNRQPMFSTPGGIPWLDPNEVNGRFADEAEDIGINAWYVASDVWAGARG